VADLRPRAEPIGSHCGHTQPAMQSAGSTNADVASVSSKVTTARDDDEGSLVHAADECLCSSMSMPNRPLLQSIPEYRKGVGPEPSDSNVDNSGSAPSLPADPGARIERQSTCSRWTETRSLDGRLGKRTRAMAHDIHHYVSWVYLATLCCNA
jgi:hypothetical protein